LKKILVTGANGFLGSHIVHDLVSLGYLVYALVRPNSSLNLLKASLPNINLINGDVNDLSSLEETFVDKEIVIHTASYVSYEAGKMPVMNKANVEGTSNVVNTCLYLKIDKLIHVSSVAAIAKRAEAVIYNEDSKWVRSPLNLDYGISKYQAEQEVWRGIEEGLKATIINPALILGKGDYSRSSAEIINKIISSKGMYPGGVNGFVDVVDVAKACITAIDHQHNSQRFILCAENLSYKDLYILFYKSLGLDTKKLRPMPAIVKGLLNKINSLIEPIFKKSILLSTQAMKYTSTISRYDNTKSKNVLGIVYRPVKETIEEMAKDFLSKNKTS
jgi:dihydroflavonol-4-reductase